MCLIVSRACEKILIKKMSEFSCITNNQGGAEVRNKKHYNVHIFSLHKNCQELTAMIPETEPPPASFSNRFRHLIFF